MPDSDLRTGHEFGGLNQAAKEKTIKGFREYVAALLEPLLEGQGFPFRDPEIDIVGSDSDADFVYDLKSGYDSAEDGDQVTVVNSDYDPFDPESFLQSIGKRS